MLLPGTGRREAEIIYDIFRRIGFREPLSGFECLLLMFWAYNQIVKRNTNADALEVHYLEEPSMAYTIDTTVGQILKDTHAVEILERHVPGISKNPMIGLAKGMTLRSLIAMPQAKQAGITEERVQQVLAEINART